MEELVRMTHKLCTNIYPCFFFPSEATTNLHTGVNQIKNQIELYDSVN